MTWFDGLQRRLRACFLGVVALAGVPDGALPPQLRRVRDGEVAFEAADAAAACDDLDGDAFWLLVHMQRADPAWLVARVTELGRGAGLSEAYLRALLLAIRAMALGGWRGQAMAALRMVPWFALMVRLAAAGCLTALLEPVEIRGAVGCLAEVMQLDPADINMAAPMGGPSARRAGVGRARGPSMRARSRRDGPLGPPAPSRAHRPSGSDATRMPRIARLARPRSLTAPSVSRPFTNKLPHLPSQTPTLSQAPAASRCGWTPPPPTRPRCWVSPACGGLGWGEGASLVAAPAHLQHGPAAQPAACRQPRFMTCTILAAHAPNLAQASAS
jgi:hypothetical protein